MSPHFEDTCGRASTGCATSSQREGFFDERHEVKDVLALTGQSDDEVEVKTRLEFFLGRWEPPSPTSDEFTGPPQRQR